MRAGIRDTAGAFGGGDGRSAGVDGGSAGAAGLLDGEMKAGDVAKMKVLLGRVRGK